MTIGHQTFITRVLLDIVDAFMSVFSGGNTDREDEAVEDGSGSGDAQEDGGSESGDYEDYEEEDGSGEGDAGVENNLMYDLFKSRVSHLKLSGIYPYDLTLHMKMSLFINSFLAYGNL